MIVDGRLAGGEQDSAVLPVDGRRLVVDQLDALGGEELGWTEQQGVLVDLTEQVGLGQRWALVGQAGLVAERPQGRKVFYRANPRGLEPMLEWMTRYAVFWSQRLDALERLLRQEDTGKPDPTKGGKK